MADITDVTTGTVGGTGYFDKIMAAINAQIDFQFSKQRLQKADFATVYLGALQSALAQSIQYVGIVEQVAASQARTTSESALLAQKVKTEMAQILNTIDSNPVVGAIGQQKSLQLAQERGFTRDAEQKALKLLLDTWSITKSVDTGTPAPSGALNTDIADMITVLRTGIGITESIYSGIADAGSDQTVANSSFVQLDASGTTGREDGAENVQPPSGYVWSQISGSPAQTLSSTTAEKPTFTVTGVTPTEVLVFKVIASYADSVPTTPSEDTVSVTVE